MKPLTNDDVNKMIAAGLPESTIVHITQKGPLLSILHFRCVIKLKRAGATPETVEVMLGHNDLTTSHAGSSNAVIR
jgi:hypothetical protein